MSGGLPPPCTCGHSPEEHPGGGMCEADPKNCACIAYEPDHSAAEPENMEDVL